MRNYFHSITKRIVRLHKGPMLVYRRGAYFLLNPRNWIDTRIIAGANYENAQIELAIDLINELKAVTFIDIGANFGLYSILLGRRANVERVIAFEPLKRNYAQLMGNVFANGLSHKVEAHRLALGRTPATAEIYIDPKSTGVARLDLATAGRDTKVFSERETISIERFDAVVSDKGLTCFIKIDVEGEAANVLAGMETFLRSNTIALQIELSGSEAAPVRALLDGLGFEEMYAIGSDSYFAPKAELARIASSVKRRG